MLTIFTPVYNRAHTIPRLYESLCQQNDVDFEWIVIDDGSSDNISEVLVNIIANAPFSVKFYSQKNRGKHTAHNKALKMAAGRYFMIIDSDDWMPPDAINAIASAIDKVDSLGESVAGVSMLSILENGEILGDTFPIDGWVGRSYEYYDKFRIAGDKQNIVRTDVLRNLPYPEFEGEMQVAPGLVWNRVCLKYEMLHLNIPVQIVEYQCDGLSARIVAMQASSPKSTELFYTELSKLNVKKTTKLKALANIARYRLHNKKYNFDGVEWNSRLELMLSFCIGALLFIKDCCFVKFPAARRP